MPLQKYGRNHPCPEHSLVAPPDVLKATSVSNVLLLCGDLRDRFEDNAQAPKSDDDFVQEQRVHTMRTRKRYDRSFHLPLIHIRHASRHPGREVSIVDAVALRLNREKKKAAEALQNKENDRPRYECHHGISEPLVHTSLYYFASNRMLISCFLVAFIQDQDAD